MRDLIFRTILICIICMFSFGLNITGTTESTGTEDTGSITRYQGSIDEAADIIVEFPTEDEVWEIGAKLEEIVDHFKEVLAGEAEVDIEVISANIRFVLDLYRRVEILEWCLYELAINQRISLLPGEGITLTIPSYCLDVDAAGPSKYDFYIPERITGEEAKWLLPLLDYAAKHGNDDLPVQELIWNMENSIPYLDLPEEQQDLFVAAVPDALRLYGGSRLRKLFRDRLKERIRDAIPIIEDFEEAAQRINERRSSEKKPWPKFDSFRLENGLLLRIRPTGSFEETTLTIVHPRVDRNARSESMPMESLEGLPPLLLAGFPGAGGSGVEWWKNNKDRVKSTSERAGDMVDALDAFDKNGLQGVEDYAVNRGFEEAVDFFKAANAGNPEMVDAADKFKNFNTDLYKARQEKEKRPGKSGFKRLNPSLYKQKSSDKNPPQPKGMKSGY